MLTQTDVNRLQVIPTLEMPYLNTISLARQVLIMGMNIKERRIGGRKTGDSKMTLKF